MAISRQIQDAAARVCAYVRETPVLTLQGSDLGLTDSNGSPVDVTLKLEHLQHTGSFKARGAFNRMLQAGAPAAGVIAASGGNHGAAVAFAAGRLGIPATIFVPAAAPMVKQDRIRSYGATVIATGCHYADALAASREHAARTGALEVHAFDDPAVVAGQGTLARELERQAPDLTHLLVAVGGGGLIAGIAGWYDRRVAVIGVEPDGCPTLFAAVKAGRPVPVTPRGLAADSLGASRLGDVAFAIVADRVAETVLVTDLAIASAQRRLWDAVRLVVEPGGATALAALLCGAWRPPPQARVGVILCGGNTHPDGW